MTQKVAAKVYTPMTTSGSQLTAFPATVPASPLKRLRMSPLEYRLISSQSASSTLSNTDARMSLLTLRPMRADTQEMTLRSSRITSMAPTIMAAAAASRDVSRPVMMSMVNFWATADSRLREALATPQRV